MTETKPVDEEIDELKELLGVALDKELADELGIDPTTVSAWRRRGSVPKKVHMQAKARLVDRFKSRGAIFTIHDALDYAVLGEISEVINQTVYYKDKTHQRVQVGIYIMKVSKYLDEVRQKSKSDTERLRLLDLVQEKARNGELLNWLDTLR